MAMMDQAELAKIVNFKKLRIANSLLHKWSLRFNICKNHFVRWANSLPKRFEEHKKQLPVPMRSAFSKDFKTMFYASEVQDILVAQYSQMVHKVLNYIYIKPGTEKYDDMHNEGLLSIVYSTWSFRNVKAKCSFTTFCYNTLFMRLRGIKFKEYKKEKRRGAKVNIYFESDRSEQLSLSDHAAKQIDPIDFVEPVDIILNKLIYAANLDEADAFLIKAFSNRKERLEKGLWYQEFSEKFTHTFKLKRITKQGLQQRVKRIHAKLWFHYKKMYGDNIDVVVA